MPDGSAGLGPSPAPPAPMQVAGMLAFIEQTGTPEKLVGLSHTKPDLLIEGHKIVCPIHVPAARRPAGELVPCALCDDEPKFVDGAILWSPDGWLRLIGHICAARYFGAGRYARLQSDHRESRRQEVEQNWLMDQLPHVSEIITLGDLLQPAAKFLDEQSHRLRQAPAILQMFLLAFRQGDGMLSVERSVKNQERPSGIRSSTGGSAQAERVAVAQILGQSLLKADLRLETKLRDLLDRFRALETTGPLERVVELTDAGQVGGAVKIYLTGLREGIQLWRLMLDAADFVSAQNFEAIRTWSEHPDNAVRLRVDIGKSFVRLALNGDNVVSMRRACPAIPDLRRWDEVLASWNAIR